MSLLDFFLKKPSYPEWEGTVKHPCPDCGEEMLFVTNLKEGNDTGIGGEDLYQCPKCKNVEAIES